MEYKISRSDEYIAHHGVKGQKHGVRRYQNEDGSLTAEGRDHYGIEGVRGEGGTNTYSPVSRTSSTPTSSSVRVQRKQSIGQRAANFAQRHKKGVAITAGVLAAGLAAATIRHVVSSNRAKKGAEEAAKILARQYAMPDRRTRKQNAKRLNQSLNELAKKGPLISLEEVEKKYGRRRLF